MSDYQYRTSELCGKPFVLRKSHIDEDIFRSVLVEEEYGYLRFAKEPDVIVDAGANIGTASVYFANQYPRAKIYAIEPAEDNYEILCLNAKAYDNIIPLHAALMGEEGTGHIQDIGNVLGYRVNLGAGGDVNCHSVVSLCRKFGISHIDLLKIDIEGAEKEVFQNACRWIHMVDAIAVELHERYISGCNKTIFDALEKEFPWEWIGGENFFFVRENRAFPVVPCGFKKENPQKLLSEVLSSVQEEKDQELKKREMIIENLVCAREEKDHALGERAAVIEKLVRERGEKDRVLGEREAVIEKLVHEREEKDRTIGEREAEIEELVRIRDEKDKTIKEREATIENLIRIRDEKDKELAIRDAEIIRLRQWNK